ncbi:integrin alpha [Nitrosomonas ureae]|uniref:FG-GAP repeat-containing protein n=1 Tax=Nitrosomonas ureae TaxID=44577 RepID=A0A1H9E4P9_9PROT|nr:integrin alpha [Nitrosomonas ureae]SEQ20704.1 FG-GAP repeat-containing protein [Nitrosomonas ureae]
MPITSINLSSLNGMNGFRLDGITRADSFGGSVSNAGDVNGDGFDDVIVGAYGADSNGSHSGSSYVVFGKLSGFNATMSLTDLDGSNGFRMNGVSRNDYSGKAVSNAGDVNGDGLDDLIVGAYRADPNGSYSGSSYVVFGKASGFNATMSLGELDGSNGFRIDGVSEQDQSGRSVSSAGDVNGDGFDDVIVGAFNADPNEVYTGSSYVIFGKSSNFDSRIDLSKLNGSNGFRLDGSEYDFLGESVSSAGDINGDGLDDLILSASQADPNGPDSGSSYVVLGKSSGFEAIINLSRLNGNNGFRLDGEKQFDFSGYSVSNAGDVNGDGFDDVIIGAALADPNGENSGSSYVVFGKATSFDATMNLSILNGKNGFRIDGEEGDNSGDSVSNAGDVNGDGFDDVIIGAGQADDSNRENSGSSYVVFGKATGFEATMNLATLNGSEGFRIDGIVAFNFLGDSVSNGGDINRDGFDDLVIGAPGADHSGAGSGSCYVIFGRSDFTGSDADFQGTPGDDNFTGTLAAESFKGEAGNDRMIARGGADSFDGGAGNDYIRILGDDFEFVDGGTGDDTLGLAGSNFNLDLPNLIDKIHSIETIALYGVGDITLTLSAQNVIDLSDTTNILKIKGNTGDSVIGLSSGWTDGGVHGNFHTYTQWEAVLLIGVEVTTDVTVA